MPRIAIGAACCASMIGGAKSDSCLVKTCKVNIRILHDLNHRSVIPYVHGGCCTVVCCLQTRVGLGFSKIEGCSILL
jgi:hypothetical protein